MKIMVSIAGHLIALLGLYGLYAGELVVGSIFFFIGGFIASKLFFCLRSAGVVMMVASVAYGYHNAYTTLVLLFIFGSVVLACLKSRSSSKNGDHGWGVDINIPFSNSDSGSGGDCGGGGD